MENLTHTYGVVKPNVPPKPLSGYNVVVFKEKNGAMSQPEILEDNASLIKKVRFSLKGRSIAYAVNSAPNLTFEQSTEIKLPAQDKHFTVKCKIRFRVSDPEPLAVWYKSDPIRLIWNEIKSHLNKNIEKSDITINDVKKNFTGIEHKILTKESEESIDDFAFKYGIEIKKIVLYHSLPEGELEVDIAEDNHKKEMRKSALNNEKARFRRAEELNEKDHELILKEMENTSKIKSDISEQFVVAVKNLAEQVDSPESFKKSAATFMQVMNEHLTSTRQLSTPQNSSNVTEMQKALAIGGTGLFDEARNILLEITSDIQSSAGDPEDRKEMLSITTRLLSETYREEEADFELIEKYLKKLFDHSIKHRDLITRERMERVKEFCLKFEKIKPKTSIS